MASKAEIQIAILELFKPIIDAALWDRPDTKRPQPTHFVLIEGGKWHPWEHNRVRAGNDNRLHAIKFDDGSIFDMVNGWRHEEDDRIVPRQVNDLAPKPSRFPDVTLSEDYRVVPRQLLEHCSVVLDAMYERPTNFIQSNDWMQRLNLVRQQLRANLAIEKPTNKASSKACNNYNPAWPGYDCLTCSEPQAAHKK